MALDLYAWLAYRLHVLKARRRSVGRPSRVSLVLASDQLSEEEVRTYLLGLQDSICAALESEDGSGRFTEDSWERPEGGGGRTRILANGSVFEKAGVAFSHVTGGALPPSASARRPDIASAQQRIIAATKKRWAAFRKAQ